MKTIRYRYGIVALIVWFFAMGASLSLAQEDVEYAFGAVVEVSAEAVILSEFDFELDEYVQMRYEFEGEFELENIDSVTQLVAGDEVEIGFMAQNDRRTIVSIYKEEDWQAEDEEVFEE